MKIQMKIFESGFSSCHMCQNTPKGHLQAMCFPFFTLHFLFPLCIFIFKLTKVQTACMLISSGRGNTSVKVRDGWKVELRKEKTAHRGMLKMVIGN